MARLVKPDGKKISELCNPKGWGTAELAHAAGIALATATKIMKGEPCFRKSLMLVGEALGESYVNLLEGSQPKDNTEEKRCEIHLHFPISKELFDEDRINTVIESLKKLIGGKGDIDMTDIKDGSTILTLSISEEDLQRLINALDERGNEIYSELGVSAIRIDRSALTNLPEHTLGPGTTRSQRERRRFVDQTEDFGEDENGGTQTAAPSRHKIEVTYAFSFRVRVLLTIALIILGIILVIIAILSEVGR